MHSDEQIKEYVYDHLGEFDLNNQNDLGEVKIAFQITGDDGALHAYTVFLERNKSEYGDWLVRTIVRADEIQAKG